MFPQGFLGTRADLLMDIVMLALERQWLGRAGVPDGFLKGVVGLSGPYDFFPFTSDSARNAFGHEADPAVTQPINHVRGDGPPMLLLTGDADETVKPRNSRRHSQTSNPSHPPNAEIHSRRATVALLHACCVVTTS